LTYDELDQDSDRLARGLEKLGVKKGERCAVSLGNNIEYATVSITFSFNLNMNFNIKTSKYESLENITG
jgi:non-ribosomal peptide synthetase component E (peptide arylation enzyme)